MIETDTKQRILDTAERFFAAQGYAATSLRSIIAEAGVNLAAVHYHFHSKESLLEAVILRRAEPVNEARLALLDEAEREADPPCLEKILNAFLAPTFEVDANFVRLMGRIHTEDDIFPAIIRKHFGHVAARFRNALRRALPEVPTEMLVLRMQFTIGAMVQALMGSEALRVAMGGEGRKLAPQEALAELLEFTIAGFRARSAS